MRVPSKALSVEIPRQTSDSGTSCLHHGRIVGWGYEGSDAGNSGKKDNHSHDARPWKRGGKWTWQGGVVRGSRPPDFQIKSAVDSMTIRLSEALQTTQLQPRRLSPIPDHTKGVTLELSNLPSHPVGPTAAYTVNGSTRVGNWSHLSRLRRSPVW